MDEMLERRRGGPLDPPRLLPPLPGAEERGAAGGWLTPPPPDGPWLVGLWSAACFYCKKGLSDLVPMAARHGVPFVALHVPEFPEDGLPGAPEATLAALGLPLGRPGVFHHRDATDWGKMIAFEYWPTFLVVDKDRRATFVLVGWAGAGDPMQAELERAMVAAAQPTS